MCWVEKEREDWGKSYCISCGYTYIYIYILQRAIWGKANHDTQTQARPQKNTDETLFLSHGHNNCFFSFGGCLELHNNCSKQQQPVSFDDETHTQRDTQKNAHTHLHFPLYVHIYHQTDTNRHNSPWMFCLCSSCNPEANKKNSSSSQQQQLRTS